MRVTQVALRPTEASNSASRPALTPELLVAMGSCYSRSIEGLGATQFPVVRVTQVALSSGIELWGD